MKINKKVIEEQNNHVNEFCLKDSIYQICVIRSCGYYTAYLTLRIDATRWIRTLFIGNAREMNAFLTAFQMKYWYMNEPF